MARHRFYASPDEFDGSSIDLSTEETHHLAHVLRARLGDELFVFDGCGREFRARFIEAGKRARLEVIEALTNEVESPLRLTLAQALAKGDKFDLVVQKATELGVSRIVPLMTDNADVKLTAVQAAKRLDRWRRISLEALKQCGRRMLVEIVDVASLESLLNASPRDGLVLVLSERGGVPVTESIAGLRGASGVSVLVGPEGGWSDRELASMRERRCISVSLGGRILRTETAAIVAVALLQHVVGDLSKPY
ncbi:MAG TPA: 16S rRNA (uracil(1498)-N(3))-methyltransferase [Blastocatellia bacterium]|nr:16S rRNA (uracil(1498)-N(3))-methyltransferase [Blastocatellia bacterium]